MKRKPKILPCPLCKGTAPATWAEQRTETKGWVYHGAHSASSEEVGCIRCCVKVVIQHPSDWPKETPSKLRGKALIQWLRDYCLAIAIERWNRLPREG